MDASIDAADAAAPALVPQIDGDWWDVARNPDLAALNGTAQQPVDFGVWRASDGTWRLWSCIRGTREPGNGRLFYQWTGASLAATDWSPVGVAMHADTSVGETAGGLQAPFVVRDGALYRMFYGSWEAICEATSPDGVAFTRRLDATGQSALFSEGPDSNTRDPMVLRVGDHYNVYYTAWVDSRAGVWVRSTTDLQTFSTSRLVSIGGVAGAGGTDAECPFVVYRPDTGFYYLFRTQRYGADPQTTIYRSRDPEDFGRDDDRYRVGTLPVAAPEIIDDGGQTYIAALRLGLDGIRIARLRWAPVP